MDRAVMDAYGWRDVRPKRGLALHWLDRDDTLARLLARNATRAEIERLTDLPDSGSLATRSDSASPTASDADPDSSTTPKP